MVCRIGLSNRGHHILPCTLWKSQVVLTLLLTAATTGLQTQNQVGSVAHVAVFGGWNWYRIYRVNQKRWECWDWIWNNGCNAEIFYCCRIFETLLECCSWQVLPYVDLPVLRHRWFAIVLLLWICSFSTQHVSSLTILSPLQSHPWQVASAKRLNIIA